MGGFSHTERCMSKMRIAIAAAITILRCKHSSPCEVILCFDLKPSSTRIRDATVNSSCCAASKDKVRQWKAEYEAADRAIHRSRFTMCQWQRPVRLARWPTVSSIFRAVTSLLHSKSTPTESFSVKNARTVSGSPHTKLIVLNSRTVPANMGG